MPKPRGSYFSAVALTLLCLSQAHAQEGATAPIYRFDPTLTIESPQPSISSAGPPVVIDKLDREVNVRLETEGAVAPYLGAGQGEELSPQELRLLPEVEKRKLSEDYHLEAGIGLFVEDKASLSLGYRFNTPPSLLDENRNDPLSTSGDVRIKFDIKVPFD